MLVISMRGGRGSLRLLWGTRIRRRFSFECCVLSGFEGVVGRRVLMKLKLMKLNVVICIIISGVSFS